MELRVTSSSSSQILPIAPFNLSPVQSGMLFHWLRHPHSGTDIEQITAELPETIEHRHFEAAWQHACDSFAALRLGFEWENRLDPEQRPHEEVKVDVKHFDWQSLAPDDQQAKLKEFLLSDRRRGFDLAVPPATRVALFHLAPQRFFMVWTFHHILIDGRAFEVVLRTVFDAYEALHSGRTPTPVEDFPYESYIEWLGKIDRESAQQFWRTKLEGYTATTPLPPELEPLAGDSGGAVTLKLKPETVAALHDYVQRHSLSLNTVVIGAWSLLLSRYSSEADVICGVTKTTRRGTVSGADSAVGLFLATIPVRLTVNENWSCKDWLRHVREEWVSLRGQEHLSLTDIRQNSALPSSATLFDSIVITENYDFGELLQSLGGSWAKREFKLHEQTGYPLAFLAYDGASITLKIEYDGSLYTAQTALHLLEQAANLMEVFVVDEDRPLSTVSLLKTEAAQTLIHDWNNTRVEYPREHSVPYLIEQQALKTPDRVAVIHEGRSLTYKEVNEGANRLAHYLRKGGFDPGQLAGVEVERSPEMLLSLLAVWKAGGTYVPLDPIYPPDRRAFMVEDSGLGVLITDEYLKRNAAAIAAESHDNPSSHPGPESLAYVIYTSGSTGKPKGVEVTHQGFTNFLLSFRDEPGMKPDDVLLAITTISFDIAGLEMFLPLITGAHSVIASREAAMQPDRLQSLMVEHGVTFMQATPATWRLLLDAGWEGKQDLKILCGGEALPPDLVSRILPRCRELWNVYGPTETTVWSSTQLLKPTDSRILIGRPIANTTMYVLDAYRNLVPPGCIGELYIGGDGLARGYRNRPELTAEKFVPDPFRPGELIYRTGDLARWMSNGLIECLGRTDHQVKIRGYRIELGEIETLIKEQPGIRQAVVDARGSSGSQQLVAYLVGERSDVVINVSDIRAALKLQLPEYMVPSAFVTLDKLPTTANGKLDRRSLPEPGEANIELLTDVYIAPRNTLESRIADVWADVLRRPRVGVTDNFFDLGGHSLLAVRLMVILGKTLGKNLPVNLLFQFPTIDQLAKSLDIEQPRVGRHSLVTLNETGTKPPIFWIPGGAAIGASYYLRHVIARLGEDRPIYRLLSDWPESLDEVETIEDRASQYLKLVRQIQPEGPYHFIGFCLGGTVGFEMAQQLRAEGEETAFLGLINTWIPRPHDRVDKVRAKFQRVAHVLSTAANNGELISCLRERVLPHFRSAPNKAEVSSAIANVEREGFGTNVDKDRAEILLNVTVDVASNYVPQPYDGRVTLFVATDDPTTCGLSHDLDPRLRWRRYVPRP